MNYVNFLIFNIICLNLYGLNWYMRKVDAHNIAMSTHAPDIKDGRARTYHIEELSGLEEYDRIKEWVAN